MSRWPLLIDMGTWYGTPLSLYCPICGTRLVGEERGGEGYWISVFNTCNHVLFIADEELGIYEEYSSDEFVEAYREECKRQRHDEVMGFNFDSALKLCPPNTLIFKLYYGRYGTIYVAIRYPTSYCAEGLSYSSFPLTFEVRRGERLTLYARLPYKGHRAFITYVSEDLPLPEGEYTYAELLRRLRKAVNTAESGEAAKRAIHVLTSWLKKNVSMLRGRLKGFLKVEGALIAAYRPAGRELTGYFVFDKRGRALVAPAPIESFYVEVFHNVYCGLTMEIFSNWLWIRLHRHDGLDDVYALNCDELRSLQKALDELMWKVGSAVLAELADTVVTSLRVPKEQGEPYRGIMSILAAEAASASAPYEFRVKRGGGRTTVYAAPPDRGEEFSVASVGVDLPLPEGWHTYAGLLRRLYRLKTSAEVVEVMEAANELYQRVVAWMRGHIKLLNRELNGLMKIRGAIIYIPSSMAALKNLRLYAFTHRGAQAYVALGYFLSTEARFYEDRSYYGAAVEAFRDMYWIALKRQDWLYDLYVFRYNALDEFLSIAAEMKEILGREALSALIGAMKRLKVPERWEEAWKRILSAAREILSC
ncbi:MAG: hypothetical protein DRJ67_07140 [Thermoprotei archaeon]|nr:MAG: hypothetical protein DRJ67_07140 [Thermoprotei archaeon]